jgi:acylpyruvate hydrolase
VLPWTDWQVLAGRLAAEGSPPGIGFTRNPPRQLRAGDVLVSHIDGIGAMRQRVTPPTTA